MREWVHKIFGGKGDKVDKVDEDVNRTKQEFLRELYRLEALAIETRVRGRTTNDKPNYNMGGSDMDAGRDTGGSNP